MINSALDLYSLTLFVNFGGLRWSVESQAVIAQHAQHTPKSPLDLLQLTQKATFPGSTT